MTIEIKSGGTWRTITAPEVKVSGTWQAIKSVEVKSGGVWRLVFSTLSVIVAATKSISDTEVDPINAYANVRVDSDGDLYAYTGASYASYETWLDAGANTEVWVQMSVFSGSLTGPDAGTTRLACTTDRTWGLTRAIVGSDDAVIDLDFYDAASGGTLLDSQRVTLHAEMSSGA